jgi:hypothetical protein
MSAIRDSQLDHVTCPRCGAKNPTGVVITVEALERARGVAMDRVHLQTKHYVVIAAFLVSLGPQLGGLQHGWHDALTPTFIGGLVAQVGAIIAAVIVGSPFGGAPRPNVQAAGQAGQGLQGGAK